MSKKNNNDTHNVTSRKRDRDCISSQVEEFLNKGGKIEVLSSPFDKSSDPKCRLGHDMGFFS